VILVATNADVQFSFRESVEPLYRRLVDLLLQSPSATKGNLKQAGQVFEALQVNCKTFYNKPVKIPNFN
jgi:CHAT domain-containing protein